MLALVSFVFTQTGIVSQAYQIALKGKGTSPDDRLNVKATDVLKWPEPGWRTLIGSEDAGDHVLVDVIVPLSMRRGMLGHHTVEYIAKHRSSTQELARTERYINVLYVDLCKQALDQCPPYSDCRMENVTSIDGVAAVVRCDCWEGLFEYDETTKQCVNINECDPACKPPYNHNCDLTSSYCFDLIPKTKFEKGYECRCKEGFEWNPSTQTCVDIDECNPRYPPRCHPEATCQNTYGSYTCTCNIDFEGDGKICKPIPYCERNHCQPHAICLAGRKVPVPGVPYYPDGFKCECEKGYQLNEQTKLCEAIATAVYTNDCERPGVRCSANERCVNTYPGHKCVCEDGFKRFPDGQCKKDEDYFLLNEPIVQFIYLFQEYNETGYELLDKEIVENMKVRADIPNEIDGPAKKCGTFPITYTYIKDDIPKQDKTRTIHVQGVDMCVPANLIEKGISLEHLHLCSQGATCHYDPNSCSARCLCPHCTEGSGVGEGGCKDICPPKIQGPSKVWREACLVCGKPIDCRESLEKQLKKPVNLENDGLSITATDEPGPVDLTSRIVFKEVPPFDPRTNCTTHTYTVQDDAGNTASHSVEVCLKITDVKQAFEAARRAEENFNRLQQDLTSFKASGALGSGIDGRGGWVKTIGYILLLIVTIVFLWEFGHKLAAIFRVLLAPLFGSPSFQDRDIAYSIWYRLLFPFASKTYIRSRVLEKIDEQENPADDEDSDNDGFDDDASDSSEDDD